MQPFAIACSALARSVLHFTKVTCGRYGPIAHMDIYPLRVGIFYRLTWLRCLALGKGAFALSDCGLRVPQLETGLDLCTNLTLVAERCLILGALVLGLLALLGPGCGALRKELLVELYCLINPKGIDQLTFFGVHLGRCGVWLRDLLSRKPQLMLPPVTVSSPCFRANLPTTRSGGNESTSTTGRWD